MRIDDVATALGISKASVSRAITGNGRIAPQTRERVLSYMREHDFQPNTIAQSLATLKTNNIAFAIPDRHDFEEIPFFLKCMVGVNEAAVQCSYNIVVVSINDNDASQMHRVVSNRKVDGAVLSRNVDDDRLLAYMLESGLPFVLIGSSDNPDVVQIDHDHRAACRELTSQLIRKWGGNTGLLGGNRLHIVNRNRHLGFCDALAERDIPPEQAAVYWDVEDEHAAWSCFEEMYAGGTRSFFCMDDMICACLLNALRDRLPPDERECVKIASFYGSRNLELFYPEIPAVSFDAFSIGVQACRILLEKLADNPVPPKTLLDYRIIV